MVFSNRLVFLLFPVLFVSLLSCETINAPSQFSKSDFAPVAVGNEWVYKSNSEYGYNYSFPVSEKYHTKLALTIQAIWQKDDTTFYSVSFHETGIKILKKEGYTVEDGKPSTIYTEDTSSLDLTYSDTIHECGGIFSHTLYLGLGINFFNRHHVTGTAVKVVNGNYIWKADNGIYLADTGLVYFHISGSFRVSQTVDLTLESFNGTPVSGIEDYL